MNRASLTIVLLALLTSGCASDRLESLSPFAGPEGISIAPVEIDSSPSSAWVYVDGKYIGNTPLVYGLAYDSNTNYIHFFLNNPEESDHDG
jgi:hypothetical protein